MKKWWMEAIGYQIYPKTFFDSNDDGIGDLNGIASKIDYLKYLGVDFIWIGPFNKSPMDDNGYDISDFYDVNEIFGTIEDAKNLIKKCHENNIKVVMDLVLNHTSDEHPWFLESKKSIDNKYRDYYIWKPSKNGEEPNNWGSFFGGSCWNKTKETDEYYMKIFSDKMPDLNWEYEPMKEELYTMINWWITQGVDGFRVDAVSHLEKEQSFEDSNMESEYEHKLDTSKFSNLPKVHKHLKDLNQKIFSKKDILTVGEVGGDPSNESVLEYAGYDSKELNMVFTFDHLWKFDKDSKKTNLLELKKTMNTFQTGLFNKGWNTLYWENHDQIRVMSKYGDTETHHSESAKMLCATLYFMWGTPYIYNGQEIGMYNYPFKKIADFQDVVIKTYYSEAKRLNMDLEKFIRKSAFETRDNARTAMQWSNTAKAGFTKGNTDVLINPNYKIINVEDQMKNPNSILNFYKQVLAYRKDERYKELINYGKFEMEYPNDEHVFVYKRVLKNKKILLVANFFKDTYQFEYDNLQYKKLLVSNYDKINFKNNIITLKPFEVFVVEL